MQTYRIIGADGREYGPVTTEQLRQWIAQGRANGYTRARLEGSSEWKTLSEFPDFQSQFAGPPPSAAAAPATLPMLGQAEADAIAQEILARDYEVQIWRCFGRAWDLVMANFGLTVGASLLIFLLSLAVSSIPFGGLLLNYVLWGGLDWMLLKMVRGQRAELGDAFAGFSLAFAPLLLFSLVSQLLTGIGLVLCLVPGIYLAVCWHMFGALVILDKRLDFWPAMEVARKVVTHHWWQLFGLALLAILLMLAGSLVVCIGFFIALPIASAAIVYAYEDIFGARPVTAVPLQTVAPAPAPPSAPPSAPPA